MRFTLPLLASLLAIPVFAQDDAGQKPSDHHQNGVSTSGNVSRVVPVDDNDPFVPNTFIGSFRMEMHRYKNGVEDKDGPANMLYWSSADKTLMAMPRPDRTASDMKVLTDLKGKWTYMLMTDDKGNKRAIKSRKKKYTFPQGEENDHEVKLTKTSETRMIDGHLCTKYVAAMDDGTWTGWVAEDIALPFKDLANSMNRTAMQKQRQDWGGLKGFPLEFEMVDNQDGTKTVVYVKDLKVGDVDPAVFSTDGYQIMEVPGVAR